MGLVNTVSEALLWAAICFFCAGLGAEAVHIGQGPGLRGSDSVYPIIVQDVLGLGCATALLAGLAMRANDFMAQQFAYLVGGRFSSANNVVGRFRQVNHMVLETVFDGLIDLSAVVLEADPSVYNALLAQGLRGVFHAQGEGVNPIPRGPRCVPGVMQPVATAMAELAALHGGLLSSLLNLHMGDAPLEARWVLSGSLVANLMRAPEYR
jgi:hypothetical protein